MESAPFLPQQRAASPPPGPAHKGGGKSTGCPVERGVEGTLPGLQDEGGRWGKGGGMDSSLCSEQGRVGPRELISSAELWPLHTEGVMACVCVRGCVRE